MVYFLIADHICTCIWVFIMYVVYRWYMYKYMYIYTHVVTCRQPTAVDELVSFWAVSMEIHRELWCRIRAAKLWCTHVHPLPHILMHPWLYIMTSNRWTMLPSLITMATSWVATTLWQCTTAESSTGTMTLQTKMERYYCNWKIHEILY